MYLWMEVIQHRICNTLAPCLAMLQTCFSEIFYIKIKTYFCYLHRTSPKLNGTNISNKESSLTYLLEWSTYNPTLQSLKKYNLPIIVYGTLFQNRVVIAKSQSWVSRTWHSLVLYTLYKIYGSRRRQWIVLSTLKVVG